MNWRAATTAGLIGLAVPILILTIDALSPRGWWPDWVWWVWPSAYMLIATAGKLMTSDYVIIGISIAVNVAIYSCVGLVLARFWPKGPRNISSAQ